MGQEDDAVAGHGRDGGGDGGGGPQEGTAQVGQEGVGQVSSFKPKNWFTLI